jgi:RNA polymerase sigma-70 factor (ECF subfamily)
VRSAQNTAEVDAAEDDLGGLIGRCAQGDQTALAALYDTTAAQVNGLALRILSDREAAEEVTADVYLQVWRTAGSYDPERGVPLAWILTLARSRAIDRLRSASNQRRRTEPLERADCMASVDAGPEEATAGTQRRRVVLGALARLSPEQRQAIELAFYRGLSHSEIATELEEPLGTIKTRIRLGMMRLRDTLGMSGRDLS